MSNEDIIQQLIFRRGRIDELIAANTAPVVDLLKAERFYVEAQIEYRMKHGEPKIVTPKP